MKPVAVTDQTFGSQVLHFPGVALVDFWAPWCGPCRMLAPILDQIGASYNGSLRILKLDVDENRETAHTYRIRSIPTLIYFRNGQIIDKLIGVPSNIQLEAKIKEALQAESN